MKVSTSLFSMLETDFEAPIAIEESHGGWGGSLFFTFHKDVVHIRIRDCNIDQYRFSLVIVMFLWVHLLAVLGNSRKADNHMPLFRILAFSLLGLVVVSRIALECSGLQ